VDEDSKTVNRRLLVIDPEERLTAEQMKVVLEGIIAMWNPGREGDEDRSGRWYLNGRRKSQRRILITGHSVQM